MIMNKTELTNKLTRKLYRVKFGLKKHSPEILVGAGVIGVVASGVLACKATLKVNETLEESRTNIEKIKVATEKGVTEAGKEYTEEDSKNDMKITYIQTGMKLAKLYALPVGLGAVSIAAILGGHNILRKRNIAISTAYAALFNDYKGYRSRVIERFGEQLDKELKYNIQTKTVEETVVNEDRTEQTVKKEVQVMNDPTGLENYSFFARFFDDGCTGWDKNPEYSLMFLNQQQNWANERLKRQGHLFINDVYDMLGIPKCKEGQTHGWIYDEKNPIGDNYVDFGIYDIHREKNRDFVNGYERVILLDFNHDGNILKYM